MLVIYQKIVSKQRGYAKTPPNFVKPRGTFFFFFFCNFQATFDMAYEVGADLNIKNVLNLTPLTLAAKLARIDMFFHILKIEREIYWQIGEFNGHSRSRYQGVTLFSKNEE